MADRPDRVGMQGASKIHVGRYTYGIAGLTIKQWGEGAALHIGRFCSLAEDITIFLGGNHRTEWATTFPFGHVFGEELGGQDIVGHPATRGDVVIGNDVWIGHGVTIGSGVTVGDGAVLSLRAVVVKDVAPYEIVGGNPAKHIRFRFDDPLRERLQRLRWWDLPAASVREITRELSQPPTVERLDDLIRRYRGS